VLENDSAVSSFVINHQNSYLTGFSVFLSVLFEPIYITLLIFIFGCFLWLRDNKRESLFLVSVSMSAGILIFLLKHLFIRARPEIQFLAETGYSFPSGHALISVVLFGSLIYFGFRIKNNFSQISILLISLLGILMLGLSRIYLNVHWFSDVLGGYFLGAFILFTGIWALNSLNLIYK
jgi:undecaprenyl-diphosphatase